jgi:transmembrane sensor
MSPRRIHVDVPVDEVQRERIEHRVFQQLARMQAAVIYEPAPALVRWTRRWTAGVAVAAGLVALVLILVWTGREGSGPAPDVFTSVQTPVGGSSRFTVASAVIDAGSDTSVSVHRDERGVSLMLKHGSVSCEVAHQDGRVFRVVAGEVEVEVVGTRFTVTRTGAAVHVEVARGKVRVRTRSEERMLTVGESWTVATEPRAETAEAGAAARPATGAAEASEAEQGDASELAPPSPSVTLPVPPPVAPARPEPARPEPKLSRREAFAAAQALESTNARRAASAYRKIANGKDAWAAVALYSLAELQTTEDRDKALRTLDELARRFPASENVEDALWLRTETLRGAGRRVEARGVAAEYLRKYPQGTYAKPAARLLKSP